MTVRANRRVARRPLDLAGKVVVLTGGAGGLGRALATELVEAGAVVALFDVDPSALAQAAEQLGTDKVSTHVADITAPDAVAAAVREAVQRHGGVDVLINNAGVSLAGRFADTTPEQFQQVLDINVGGSVTMLHILLPQLRPGGHVVQISSMSGIVGMPFSSAYSTSKFAVRGLAESLALELPDAGIGVSAVILGATNTGLAGNLRYAERTPAAMRQRLRNATEKSTRLTAPADAARAIVAGMRRRRVTIVVGPDAHALRALSRVSPGLLRRLLGLVR